MQETLEVRLKESLFPLHHRNNWAYKAMAQQQQQLNAHIAQQQQQLHSSHQQQPFTSPAAVAGVSDHRPTGTDAAIAAGSFRDCSASGGGSGPAAQSQRSVDVRDGGQSVPQPTMVVGPNRSSMLILSQPNNESTSQASQTVPGACRTALPPTVPNCAVVVLFSFHAGST